MIILIITQAILLISQHNWIDAKKYDDNICELCACKKRYDFKQKKYFHDINCGEKNLTKMPQFKSDYINKTVVRYSLVKNFIENVSRADVQHFPYLETLDLKNNTIKILPDDVFSSLTKLETLNLAENEMSILPTLPAKLQALHLSGNNISTVQADAFSHLNGLKYLSLQKNRIHVVNPAVFSKLKNLRFLETSGLIDCCNAYRKLDLPQSFRCNNKLPPFPECGLKLIPEDSNPTESGGRNSVGKLQLYNSKGVWEYLNDKNWTKADADVTCRDLGFPSAIEYLILHLTFPNKNRRNKSLLCKDYRCNRNEQYLAECPVNEVAISSGCDENRIVGVRCKDEGKRLCSVCMCSNFSVDCSNRKLVYLPWTRSQFGPNMTRFNISGNEIRKIWRGLLESFPFVKNIDISWNQISDVQESLFQTSKNMVNLSMAYNKIKEIPAGLFHGLTSLRYVDFSWNQISDVQENLFQTSKNMVNLSMAHNKIKEIPAGLFHDLTSLRYVDFSSNSISHLPDKLLQSPKNLTYLDLSNNKLESLPRNFFSYGTKLKYLDLSNNKLESLPKNFFPYGNQLEYLILRKNNLMYIKTDSLRNLENLRKLDISGNLKLEVENWKFLREMKKLKTINVSSFSECCFVTRRRPDINCHSPESAFSDCDQLIKSASLRYVVWVFLVFIFGGNLIAMMLRLTYLDNFYVQNILILSLNIGDFLMGIYLSGIIIRDLQWRGQYYRYDREWKSSAACKSLGALALVSSEVCVMSLAVITFDRRRVIVYGLLYTPLKRRTYRLVVFLIWFISSIIAIIPAVVKSYFYDEERGEGYYGTNGLCLPLQLPGEKDPAWEYCLVIFGIFNFLIACYMAVAYCSIFYSSFISGRNTDNPQGIQEGSEMSIRFFAIVFTDILCWFPIAVLIFISLGEIVSDEDNVLYAWFSICVTTVNSAINPIIYTFTSPFFRSKFKGWFRSLRLMCSSSERENENNFAMELQTIVEQVGTTTPSTRQQSIAEVQQNLLRSTDDIQQEIPQIVVYYCQDVPNDAKQEDDIQQEIPQIVVYYCQDLPNDVKQEADNIQHENLPDVVYSGEQQYFPTDVKEEADNIQLKNRQDAVCSGEQQHLLTEVKEEGEPDDDVEDAKL